MQQSRRNFLKASALALSPLVLPATVLGREGFAPNSKITFGGIGLGGRGEYVLDRMLVQPDVKFIASRRPEESHQSESRPAVQQYRLCDVSRFPRTARTQRH
ncbi:MAG: hypothetical protein FWE95_10500 [Planctomycetaceae bacterium]|nr:hypothetical protein [Planctomycetaceae bacterium]